MPIEYYIADQDQSNIKLHQSVSTSPDNNSSLDSPALESFEDDTIPVLTINNDFNTLDNFVAISDTFAIKADELTNEEPGSFKFKISVSDELINYSTSFRWHSLQIIVNPNKINIVRSNVPDKTLERSAILLFLDHFVSNRMTLTNLKQQVFKPKPTSDDDTDLLKEA